MILMYTSSGSLSCRKAKKYIKDNDIPYQERNIMREPLRESEIRYLLERSENGTDDIISQRSKTIRESGADVSSMRFSELVKFVLKHPDVLKRPIILDQKALMSGYDEEEISIFKPRTQQLQFI